MYKKIKDLSESEIEAFCDARDTVKRGYTACRTCPLRWGKQCMYCKPIISNMLYARILKVIGDIEVEVE